MLNRFTPNYYLLESDDTVWEATDAIALLDDLDGFETWAIGDALAYLIRAGRKTEDPNEDLRKARNSIVKALEHRDARMMPHD